MRDPKRYAFNVEFGTPDCTLQIETGDWVKYEDWADLRDKYDFLQDEDKKHVDEVNGLLEEIDRLKTRWPNYHVDTLIKAEAENARLEEQCEKHAQEARTLYDFMSHFDWILYSHNCKGGASETHAKLDALRAEYLAWKNPGEERGL